MCVSDFREGGPFCPPLPICEQPRKCRSWIGLIWQRTVLFKFTDYQRFNYVIKNWDVGEKWQQILHVLVRFQIFVKFHVYSTSKSLEIEAEAGNCSFFPLLVINLQKPFPSICNFYVKDFHLRPNFFHLISHIRVLWPWIWCWPSDDDFH